MILKTHKDGFIRKHEKTHNTYKCEYPTCGWVFDAWVRKVGGSANLDGTVNKCVSSQVKCPSCGNFMKTWE